MSKAPRSVPTEKIVGPDWEDSEWVQVRTYLSGIDRQRIRDASTRINPETGETHADVAGGTLAMLRAGVSDWHLTFADGSAVPLSDEGFGALPASYLAYILNRLTELWAAWETPAPEPVPGQTLEAATRAATFPAAQGNPGGAAGPGEAGSGAGGPPADAAVS